ncbi:MAG: radical SAM protein [Clostridia bacterium]|nr:radical SAM protein [Clostridia bacterium]
MEKIKRFIECYIPIEACNFKCHYCYISQHGGLSNKINKLTHSSQYIAQALSKRRMGGVCVINLCAWGETLISEEILDVIRALLEEGHYVMVVTNGSLTNRFEKIAEFPKKILNHLFFKFSFHYLELIRLNILDTFFNNVKMMQNAGASFTIEITPTDELEPYIDEIKEVTIRNLGALPHMTIARVDSGEILPLTNHKVEEYYNIWGQFNSDLFNFKKEIFGVKRREFCYAGEWSICVDLLSGEYRQCYGSMILGNIYKNIKKPLKFIPIGCNCIQPHCYNGHAFIGFGNIPEIETPTYAQMRNRVQNDGKEWITKDMKEIMQTKLGESNKQYNKRKQKIINQKNICMLTRIKIKEKIKRQLLLNKKKDV